MKDATPSSLLGDGVGVAGSSLTAAAAVENECTVFLTAVGRRKEEVGSAASSRRMDAPREIKEEEAFLPHEICSCRATAERPALSNMVIFLLFNGDFGTTLPMKILRRQRQSGLVVKVGDGIFELSSMRKIFFRGSLQRYVSQKSNKKRRQIR